MSAPLTEQQLYRLRKRTQNLFWTAAGDHRLPPPEGGPDDPAEPLDRALARAALHGGAHFYLQKDLPEPDDEDALWEQLLRDRPGLADLRGRAGGGCLSMQKEDAETSGPLSIEKEETGLWQRPERRTSEKADDLFSHSADEVSAPDPAAARAAAPLVTERPPELVEREFGRSYLDRAGHDLRVQQLCRGLHEHCSLHWTRGILHDPVTENYAHARALRAREENLRALRKNADEVRRSIRDLQTELSRAFALRSEEETIRSTYGSIIPSLLWKVDRADDPALFSRKIKSDETDFVIDLLIDASGSQEKRRSAVALQAYIICEALSTLHLPFRVTSFCTFWESTVLQRFRDYRDDRSANGHVLEFAPSANNRDGLAFRAVGQDLLARPEKNRLLIVLSDGKPYDIPARRAGAPAPSVYTGEAAVRDAGLEVRRLRQSGVLVLGVFSGAVSDLSAEQAVFGRDFAYIRSIHHCAPTVGR